MTVAWPAWLPQYVRRDSYGYKPDDVLAASEMEGGPVLLRQKFSNGATQFQGLSMTLDSDQTILFQAFWAHDLKRGSQSFFLPLLINDVPETVRVQMVGPPAYDRSFSPTYARVTFAVRMLDSLELSVDAYAAVSTFGGPSGMRRLQNLLDYSVNTVIPQMGNEES